MNKSSMTDVVLIYPEMSLDLGATTAIPHFLLTTAAPLAKKGYTARIINQRVNAN